ncbi:hypothetical protein PAMP_023917 [Pampus punctatissimus]
MRVERERQREKDGQREKQRETYGWLNCSSCHVALYLQTVTPKPSVISWIQYLFVELQTYQQQNLENKSCDWRGKGEGRGRREAAREQPVSAQGCVLAGESGRGRAEMALIPPIRVTPGQFMLRTVFPNMVTTCPNALLTTELSHPRACCSGSDDLKCKQQFKQKALLTPAGRTFSPEDRLLMPNHKESFYLKLSLYGVCKNTYCLLPSNDKLMIDTPTSPVTSGLPLFFVITVTAIKQGYEDWLRHKADNEVNGAPVFVVRSGSLVKTKSKNIRVGDIVRVAKDETFPVDLVLLSSDRVDGTCHITTASLDGETNLKTHYSVAETSVCQSVSQLEALQAVVECQQPEADLYRFVGRITVTQHGEEIVRSMNTFLIIYLCILLFEAVLSTILKYAWQAEDKWDEPFYNQKTEQERNSSPILKFISDFLAFLVLYNFIIPISLYVTVEMQKFLGSFFIGWDLDLYHEESDQKAQVNTSDLNEELGQVEYVFTDKTGTLTENEMQFRECSINGTKYREVNGKLIPEGLSDDSPDGSTPHLIGEELLFLKAVSLCHTVQISYDQPDCLVGGGDPFSHANGFSPNHMEYYASSPDEKALVEAAKRIGVAFTHSSGNSMEIKTFGKSEKYELLHVLEFDANRRRMSVILQTPSGGKVLFTKGAESAILPFTTSGEIEKTRLHVDEFALKGLRTLVVACRHFSPEEYFDMDKRLNSARTALQQREERLQEAFSYIERDLQLLGATGVEDKLQDKVQETIEALRLAGIKVWVLTGDKHETAVSVSLSCGHFHRTMNILELLQQRSDNECAEQLRRLARRIKEDHVIQHGLVVDGASLSLALREHEKLFMEVCKNCSAVLCCRMAPLQKAKVPTSAAHTTHTTITEDI